VINVEQRTLGAFKQDVLSLLAERMEHIRDVRRHGKQLFGVTPEISQGLFHVNWRFLIVMLQDEVVVGHQCPQAFLKGLRIRQITKAQTLAGHLVLVGRSDAAARGPDALLATGPFTRLVQPHMGRQDQGARLTDPQTRAHVHAPLFQHADLVQQGIAGKHHPVADHAGDVLAQDARRNQVQGRGLPVNHQGVARIVAALETGYTTDLLCQQVNDLTLAFIPTGCPVQQRSYP